MPANNPARCPLCINLFNIRVYFFRLNLNYWKFATAVELRTEIRRLTMSNELGCVDNILFWRSPSVITAAFVVLFGHSNQNPRSCPKLTHSLFHSTACTINYLFITDPTKRLYVTWIYNSFVK